MGDINLLCFLRPNELPFYLSENQNTFNFISTENLKSGKVQCSASEKYGLYKWLWELPTGNKHTVSRDAKKVLFHPIHSCGTAAVRGNKVLKENLHHYWEIEILTRLFGTDVMVGIGTSEVVLSQKKFYSMLGYDDQSWGYSYRGKILHSQRLQSYGEVFGQDSIIGVHLDMYAGTLEYYLNKKSLGIAFRGLKGKVLYPMLSSTASQSSMKLTCSLSLELTLQMQCLMVIRNNPAVARLYHSIPGLSRIIKPEYFWLLPREPQENEEKRQVTIEDEAALPLLTNVEANLYLRQMKRLKTNKRGLCDEKVDPNFNVLDR